MPTSLVSETDHTEALADQVRRAAAERRPLRIVGGDTKAFYGRPVVGESLNLAAHTGVIRCDPTELVVVVRAGTPVAQIEAQLARHDQTLAFEPPLLGPNSTIGGVVAAGLAGPRRPFVGSVRDFVLGATVMDGQGQVLKFGGTVFKNVAGFDGFRLMAGALGCLGVLLDISIRVTSRPRREASLALEMSCGAARKLVSDLMRAGAPLSGAFHDRTQVHLRFSGGEAGVAAAARDLGGEAEGPEFWETVRDFRHPRLAEAQTLWRISVPQTTGKVVAGEMLAWDWGGAVRWFDGGGMTAAQVRQAATAHGGHATLFRGTSDDGEVFQPLPAAMLALHRRLKAAFDPAGVLNPGRMYAGL